MATATLALVLAAVLFSTTGQLLLKSGARDLAGLGRFGFLVAAVTHPRVLCGLAAWIASTVCWLHVLRVTPLSRAYAMTSLTYILVPLASIYILGEEIRPLHALGIVLVTLGTACVLAGR